MTFDDLQQRAKRAVEIQKTCFRYGEAEITSSLLTELAVRERIGIRALAAEQRVIELEARLPGGHDSGPATGSERDA